MQRLLQEDPMQAVETLIESLPAEIRSAKKSRRLSSGSRRR